MFKALNPAPRVLPFLAVLSKVRNGYSGSFPDLPGLVSSGKDEATARLHLSEALALHLYQMQLDGDDLPVKRTKRVADLGPDEQLVQVEPAPINPVSLLLGDLFESSGRTLTDLAPILGMKRPALSRLQDPFYWGHSLATLRTIAERLDRTVEVSFKAAS
jgi:antitoxin HicB